MSEVDILYLTDCLLCWKGWGLTFQRCTSRSVEPGVFCGVYPGCCHAAGGLSRVAIQVQQRTHADLGRQCSVTGCCTGGWPETGVPVSLNITAGTHLPDSYCKNNAHKRHTTV